MSKMLHLEIVTPDRLVLSQDVDYVGAPGYEGEFGVLPSHIPFLTALQVGSLYYKFGGKNHYVFVAGGFAEVSGDKVTILAEVAERASDIDLERARKAKERAEARMRQQQDNLDFTRARAAMARAMARIQARESGASSGTLQ